MKKKRFTAAITGLLMALTLLPVPTLADTGDFSVSSGGQFGTDYTYQNEVLTITSPDSYVIGMASPGETTTERIVVDTGSDTLTTIQLTGVNISATNGSAIEVKDNSNVRIDVSDDSDGNENLIESGDSAAVNIGSGAKLEIGSLGSSGAGITIAHSTGNAVSIGANAELTVRGGVIDIYSTDGGKSFAFADSTSSLYASPEEEYDLELQAGTLPSGWEEGDEKNLDRKTVKNSDGKTDIKTFAGDCPMFNSSSAYTLEIPLAIIIEQAGSDEAPDETFTIDVEDETNGEYDGQLEFDLYAEDPDCGITGDSYDTAGEGEYEGTLKLRLREGSENHYTGNSCLVFSETNDESANWTYDNTIWYVTVDQSGNTPVFTYHKNSLDDTETYTRFEFTNTYGTATQTDETKPVIDSLTVSGVLEDGCDWYADTVTLSASASDDGGNLASLVLKVNGNVVAESDTEEVTFDLNAAWFEANATDDNAYTVTAIATDAAGNSASDEKTFYADFQTPATTITGDTNGYAKSADDITFTTTDNANVAVYVEVDDQTFVKSEKSFRLSDLITGEDGAYTITAYSTDPAGNKSEEVSKTITIDTTGPVITGPKLTGDKVGATDVFDGAVTIEASAEDAGIGLKSLKISVNDVVVFNEEEDTASVSLDKDWFLENVSDEYTVKVVAVDKFGFETTETKTFEVRTGTGSGSVTLKGWTYGETPNSPVPASSTNGTDNVTYEYKEKNGTYTEFDIDSGKYPTAAGDYVLKATFAETADASEATATTEFTIAKKKVTAISDGPITKVYDGNTNATISFKFADGEILTGDEVIVTATGTYASPDAGTNIKITSGSASISGAGSENYDVSLPELTGSITAKPVSVNITGDATAAYGSEYRHVASSQDAIESNMFTVLYDGKTEKPENVGTYTLTAEPKNGNYTISGYTTGSLETFEITKADISTLSNKMISVRNTDTSGKNYPLSGFGKTPCDGEWTVVSATNEDIFEKTPAVNGDNVTFTMAESADTGDESVVTLRFTPDANYNPKEVTLTISVISKEAANVKVSVKNFTYGESGQLTKDVTFNDSLSTSGAEWDIKYTGNVDNGTSYNSSEIPTLPGSYTVTAIYEDDNHKGENTASFTISKKALSWNTDNLSASKKPDGTTDAQVTGTLGVKGIIKNDAVFSYEGLSAQFPSEDPGHYDIAVTVTGAQLTGDKAFCYTLPGNAPHILGTIRDIAYQTISDTLRVELEKGIIDTPEGVDKTVDEIESALSDSLEGYSTKAFYDVTLQFFDGQNWVDATEDQFPDGGIEVLIPYPEGTDSSYDLAAACMYIADAFGKSAGDTEVLSVTKTEEGIKVTISGLASPVAVAWKTPEAPEQTPVTPGQTPEQGVQNIIATGDSPVVIYAALAAAAAAIVALLVYRRRK